MGAQMDAARWVSSSNEREMRNPQEASAEKGPASICRFLGGKCGESSIAAAIVVCIFYNY
jgi:hypothetical protein